MKKLFLGKRPNYKHFSVESDRTVFSGDPKPEPILFLANLTLVLSFVFNLIDTSHWFPKILFSVLIVLTFLICNVRREQYLFRDPRRAQVVLRLLWLRWVLLETQFTSNEMVKLCKASYTVHRDRHTHTVEGVRLSIASQQTQEDLYVVSHIQSREDDDDDLLLMRQLSEAVAKRLRMDIHDHREEPVKIRLFELLDETVSDHWAKRICEGEILPELPEPLELQSTIEEDNDALEIVIPPLNSSTTTQRIIMFVVFVMINLAMSLTIILGMKASIEEYIPLIVIEGIAMVVAGYLWLRECFLNTVIRVDSKIMSIEHLNKRTVVPLSTLEEWNCGVPTEHSKSLFKMAQSGGLIATSDTQWVRVGIHLTQEEILYLHNRVLQHLTK